MDAIVSWIGQWFSPLWILFFIIVVGYAIGKIKIRGISLDLSSVLILSVLIGVFFHFYPRIYIGEAIIFRMDETFQTVLRFLSSFGTSLFISSVGVSSGYELALPRRKKNYPYFFFGGFVVLLNLLLMNLIFYADGDIEKGLLYGVFCGAMTSTPGLTAICESSADLAEQAAAGYGCAYLLGVSGIVFFVQSFAKKQKESSSENKTTSSDVSFAARDLALFSITILSGILLGTIPLFHTNISLGNTGGILLTGILFGYILKTKKPDLKISQSSIQLFRTFGLLLFFVGTGIPAGMTLMTEFQPHVFVYGILLTVFPICVSYLLLRCGMKVDKSTALNTVCGVMTSTPAFGILSRCGRQSADTAVYSTAYAGALLTTVFCLNILT